jgi:hypothetical protein
MIPLLSHLFSIPEVCPPHPENNGINTHSRVDDAREVAHRFGTEHGMSDNYIDQIEAFIRAHIS